MQSREEETDTTQGIEMPSSCGHLVRLRYLESQGSSCYVRYTFIMYLARNEAQIAATYGTLLFMYLACNEAQNVI